MPDVGGWPTMVAVIGVLWLVTLGAASFAAVNEREIRRRNYDLLALTRLSMRLEESLRPTDVALDPERDPWLCAALPGAANLVLAAVYVDGGVAGVLVAEHRTAQGSRVQVRTVGMLERYASHAVLALTSASLLAQMRRLADTDGLTAWPIGGPSTGWCSRRC